MQLTLAADLAELSWNVSVDGAPTDPPSAAGTASAVSLRFGDIDLAALDSARLLAVWLEDGETLTLAATRPRGAKGQDRDSFVVALPARHAGLNAFDPRLSTEYSDAGEPRRFGVELWLGEDAEAEQRVWRIGGEAAPELRPRVLGQISAFPMRAHAADVSGFALYVLLRP